MDELYDIDDSFWGGHDTYKTINFKACSNSIIISPQRGDVHTIFYMFLTDTSFMITHAKVEYWRVI